VAATLVVARGPSVFVFAPDGGAPREIRARGGEGRPARALGPEIARALRDAAGPGPVVVVPVRATEGVAAALGRAVSAATPTEARQAQRRLPPWPAEERRRFLLELARSSLDEQFRSPEEVVISLAREEARFERAVDREDRAAEAFVGPTATPLELQAREWSGLRERLREHHHRLRSRLEQAAVAFAPNLSSVLGPRVAGRLIAAAGGLSTLARISSSRLQLLGARRRPSPDRGPRFGLIYTCESLATVPEDRRAAFARSLAALASIAARADATTRTDLSQLLIARRERRAGDLRRGRR
jgi:hypothetical protein